MIFNYFLKKQFGIEAEQTNHEIESASVSNAHHELFNVVYNYN